MRVGFFRLGSGVLILTTVGSFCLTSLRKSGGGTSVAVRAGAIVTQHRDSASSANWSSWRGWVMVAIISWSRWSAAARPWGVTRGAVKPDFGAVCAVWNSWRYSECGVMRADGAVDRVARSEHRLWIRLAVMRLNQRREMEDGTGFEQMVDDHEKATQYLYELALKLLELGGSDIFITAGSPPALKVNQLVRRLGDQRLRPQQTMLLVRSIMNDRQVREFDQHREVNFS